MTSAASDIAKRDLARDLRTAMANLATGLTVVTTATGGRPHGSTLSAVVSPPVDPPMILLSLARTSSLLNRLSQGGRFGIDILPRDLVDRGRMITGIGQTSQHVDLTKHQVVHRD